MKPILLVLASCTLASTLACNGALRFDSSRMDAGTDGCTSSNCNGRVDAGTDGCPSGNCNGRMDAGTDSCTSGNCGWSPETCATPPCPFDCLGGATCSGTCGPACTAGCAGATNCTLSANGEGAKLMCLDRASCAFQATDDATVTCQGSATCTVYCASSCVLNCSSGATCRLQCAGGSATTVVGVGMCRDTTP